MIAAALVPVTQAAMLAFVVSTMVAMGLELTPTAVIRPLRQVRLVVLLLVGNFVVVPGVAVLLVEVLPLDDAAGTAVLLLGCTAGAPFLPRLARRAHGDVGLAVAVMVLLMVVTVGFAPLEVPVLVEGATVSAGDIASSLVLFMLVPLIGGLLVGVRYPDVAGSAAGPIAQTGSAALLLGISASMLVTWREVLGALGSGIFVALALLLVASYAVGSVSGLGLAPADRSVLGLATAQRNIAAALVVATSLDGDVIVFTLVGAILVPVALMVVAAELGRRRAEPSRGGATP